MGEIRKPSRLTGAIAVGRAKWGERATSLWLGEP